MWKGKKISVVFPAYNEAENIQAAIREFRATGVVDEVVVADNNSTDNTFQLAKKAGARVVTEKIQGYGAAMQRAMLEAKGDIIVSCEPDGTLAPGDIFKFLAYADEFDVILCTMTSKELIWSGANMGWFLRVGNWILAKFLEYMFNGPSLTDVGISYKLVHRRAMQKLAPQFTVTGNSFSPEFIILCFKNRIRTVEIPINYRPRRGHSKITGHFWKTFWLGWRMVGLIISYRLGMVRPGKHGHR